MHKTLPRLNGAIFRSIKGLCILHQKVVFYALSLTLAEDEAFCFWTCMCLFCISSFLLFIWPRHTLMSRTRRGRTEVKPGPPVCEWIAVRLCTKCVLVYKAYYIPSSS